MRVRTCLPDIHTAFLTEQRAIPAHGLNHAASAHQHVTCVACASCSRVVSRHTPMTAHTVEQTVGEVSAFHCDRWGSLHLISPLLEYLIASAVHCDLMLWIIEIQRCIISSWLQPMI
mmetsp:Transcript_77531/g.153964  ORF Transcript_77531/g.153964 Transcript_77531/m.153964 type:complete len:117 (-) Transcript_77531:180-530(-)